MPLFQRPQQLARALARCGALVFYIQPPAFEREGAITEIESRLFLSAVPVEAFREMEDVWHYVLTWNARRYLPAFERPRIIYDYVDDIAAFHGNPGAMRQDHRRLLVQAEVVLATAQVLHDEVSRARPDALLVANGVEYEHFTRARREARGEPPPDLAPVVAKGRPIVGYHGALARWFDYDLVAEVALHRPDLSFVLIGPDFDFSLRDTRLLSLPNMTWLGPRPYAELPQYLAWFEVGIIPFRPSAVTHATSPIKLFEFMAAHIPTVITPMKESMRNPLAIVADTPEAWSRAIELRPRARAGRVLRYAPGRGGARQYVGGARREVVDRACGADLTGARHHAKIQSLAMPSPESRPSPRLSHGPIVPRSAAVRLMRRGLGRAYELAWNMWHARHVPGWRRELDRIYGEAPDASATLLFLPSVPWTTLLAQRPQHMARALARAGAVVFYMVPAHDVECTAGFHMIEPRLYLAKVPPSVFADRRVSRRVFPHLQFEIPRANPPAARGV